VGGRSRLAIERVVRKEYLAVIITPGCFIGGGLLCGAAQHCDLAPGYARHLLFISIVAQLYGTTFLLLAAGERASTWAGGRRSGLVPFYRPWLPAAAIVVVCSAVLDSQFKDNLGFDEARMLGLMVGLTFALGCLRPGFRSKVVPRLGPIGQWLQNRYWAFDRVLQRFADEILPHANSLFAEMGSRALIIPPASSSDRIQLKLKRSQRKGLFGKVIFMLDARMEVPREEYDLIRRYDLGDLVIYDSLARRKHTDALQAHLESTREQASVFDSAAKQFLSIGKTMFRFARAFMGRCGSLLLYRDGLPPSTSCRSPGAPVHTWPDSKVTAGGQDG
jgi:hypothetical protein